MAAFLSFNEHLESASFSLGPVPISVLDLCGSVLVCLRYRAATTGRVSPPSWLESLLSCALMQFGGTTLTGFLLGQTPSWILSHSAFPALVLAWWCAFHCPGDIFHKAVNHTRFGQSLVVPVVTILSAVSSGHAVTSWGVDKALSNAYHINSGRIAQSVLTCILAGTLSASGGGLLADCLSLLRSPSYVWSKPQVLEATPQGDAASKAITKAFFLASFYYFVLPVPYACGDLGNVCLGASASSVSWLGPSALLPLSRPGARAVVGALQVLSALIVLVQGHDPTYTTLSRGVRALILVQGGEPGRADAISTSTTSTSRSVSRNRGRGKKEQ